MTDPQADDWGGLAWAPWCSFDLAIDSKLIPTSPGLYRFRDRHEPGLIYIGEGVNRRRRLRTLARYRRLRPAHEYLDYPPGSKRPHRGHYAAPYIRRCEDAGSLIDVSWSGDEFPDRESRRRAEALLIAAHVDTMRIAPPCQHGGAGLDAWLASRGRAR